LIDLLAFWAASSCKVAAARLASFLACHIDASWERMACYMCMQKRKEYKVCEEWALTPLQHTWLLRNKTRAERRKLKRIKKKKCVNVLGQKQRGNTLRSSLGSLRYASPQFITKAPS
jgi:hypothetical protein